MPASTGQLGERQFEADLRHSRVVPGRQRLPIANIEGRWPQPTALQLTPVARRHCRQQAGLNGRSAQSDRLKPTRSVSWIARYEIALRRDKRSV